MIRKGVIIQERGLMLLIGAAVVISGLFLLADLQQPDLAIAPVAIHLDQVTVLLPRFVQQEPINVNAASLDELILLPGIGPALAQRIIDYRTEHGPFASIVDLEHVSGIGPQTVQHLTDEAVAGPGSP